MTRRPARIGRMFVCAAGFSLASLSAQTPPAGQTPVFRGNAAVIVPVDVRVLDSGGKPVTGLTAADFTVLEENVRQEIRLFVPTTLTPVAAGASGTAPLQRVGNDATPVAQNRRVFLIVLGRGRLQPPSKGVDAMLKFVRERLMPQDQIALFAFNRATDFTTDHAYLTAVLERFKKTHEDIDAELRQQGLEDLASLYGVSRISAAVQVKIDDLFRVPGGPAFRTPPPAKPANEARIQDDRRAAGDAAIGRNLAAASVDAGATRLGDATSDRLADVGFSDWIVDSTRGIQDLTKLYQGIEYLRSIDGEKHLIFVTERGMSLPRLEDHTSVAATANDARVAINVIQTGGLPQGNVDDASSGLIAPPPGLARVIPAAASLHQTFTVHSLRTIAELTGGVASIYDYADNAVTRIVNATGSSYLLGYTPSNSTMDGRYRRITVQVAKRGATVHWRHGYYAQDQRRGFDRRQAVTYTRIATATNFAGTVSDIRVDVKFTESRDSAGRWLTADIKIDPTRLGWTIDGTDRVGGVDVAIFAADPQDSLVGEHWQAVPLRLPSELFERAKSSGLTYTVRMPLKGEPSSAKVIVYDFAADLLGSALRRLR